MGPPSKYSGQLVGERIQHGVDDLAARVMTWDCSSPAEWDVLFELFFCDCTSVCQEFGGPPAM